MKKIILLAVIMSFTSAAFCQTDKDDIKKAITTMFDGMRKSDSTVMRSVFAKGLVFQGVSAKGGDNAVVSESPEDFLKSVATPHKEVYDERITWGDIKIDGPLASAWTPYKFYVGDKFSHCGIDFYQLMKTKDGWKIIYIIDTRRKDNCPE